MVGDAEGYVKMENNLQDWLEEYRRLMDVIAAWEAKTGSIQELVGVDGVLEDAVKSPMPWPLSEDRERVARFETAMSNLNAEDNKFIEACSRACWRPPKSSGNNRRKKGALR